MARGIDKQKRLNSGGTKTNPNHIVYGNKDGQIEFGHLHLANSGNVNGDVTSGVMLQAHDARHYITLDNDGPRQGWTSSRSPGPYQIWCASDHAGKTGSKGGSVPSSDWAGVGFFLLAENGDIIIRAPKGRIRMSAMDIDIRAEGPDNSRGSINLDSNESVNIKTGNFDVKADKSVSIFCPRTINIAANVSLNLTGNFVRNLTVASRWQGDKSNPLTKEKYKQKQNYLNIG
jgi:hypothetical protein